MVFDTVEGSLFNTRRWQFFCSRWKRIQILILNVLISINDIFWRLYFHVLLDNILRILHIIIHVFTLKSLSFASKVIHSWRWSYKEAAVFYEMDISMLNLLLLESFYTHKLLIFLVFYFSSCKLHKTLMTYFLLRSNLFNI